MVEVQSRRARLPGLLHPDVDLLRRPVQRLADLVDRPVVAEHQPGRAQRGELAYRGQCGLVVEVRRWRGRPDVPGVRQVDAGRVADVQVPGVGVDQADVMLGVAGGVVAVQAPAAAEIDSARVVQGHDALGGHRGEHAEEPFERPAVDHPGAGHEPARVG